SNRHRSPGLENRTSSRPLCKLCPIPKADWPPSAPGPLPDWGISSSKAPRPSFAASCSAACAPAEESDVLIYPIRYNTQRDYGRSTGGGVSRGPTARRGGWGDILGVILGGGTITMGGGGGSAGTSAGEYARGKDYLENLARNSGWTPL